MADIPGLFITPLLQDGFDRDACSAETETAADILATFDRTIVAARETLGALEAQQLLEPWTYRRGGQVVFELPR